MHLMNSVTNLDEVEQSVRNEREVNNVLGDNLLDRGGVAKPLIERDDSSGLDDGNLTTPFQPTARHLNRRVWVVRSSPVGSDEEPVLAHGYHAIVDILRFDSLCKSIFDLHIPGVLVTLVTGDQRYKRNWSPASQRGREEISFDRAAFLYPLLGGVALRGFTVSTHRSPDWSLSKARHTEWVAEGG